MRKLFKKLSLMFPLVIIACVSEPEIPIPETLEYSLGDQYNQYVNTLNKALNNDSGALVQFLKIDKIFDGAAYEHGWVLIELMKKSDDIEFSKAVSELSESELEMLKAYLNAGFDIYPEEVELLDSFPNTSRVLKLSVFPVHR